MSLETLSEAKRYARYIHEGIGIYGDHEPLPDGIAAYIVEKGFDVPSVIAGTQSGGVGNVLNAYLFGNEAATTFGVNTEIDESNREQMKRIILGSVRYIPDFTPDYTGTIFENRSYIQTPPPQSRSGSELYSVRNNGACRFFDPKEGLLEPTEGGIDIRQVPIAIVGMGASGILASATLSAAGFQKIDTFDKTGRTRGIWEQKDVKHGSKNNPFKIQFGNSIARSAHETTHEGSGRDITDFLASVEDEYYNEQNTPKKAVVKEIEAGDLSHKVRYLADDRNLRTSEYPIVINAPGNGIPLRPNRPGHMETNANASGSEAKAGIRWQKQLEHEELQELAGKRVVLVGLGNSTMEMVVQFQKFEKKTGTAIDFRILTHYAKDMVGDPQQNFTGRGSIARNVDAPDLSKLAYDITEIRSAYDEAFKRDKIIHGVKNWEVRDGQIEVRDGSDIVTIIPYEKLFTLIGYGQSAETMESASISVTDRYLGRGAFDFDGEVQQNPGALGRERVFPGYFGLGPILKNKYNPNALVIPGIQNQLADLIPSLVIRAFEYASRHPEVVKR